MGRQFNPEPHEDDLFDQPSLGELVILAVAVLVLSVVGVAAAWGMFHVANVMLA